MKRLFIIALISFCASGLFAQGTIAKLKYQDAEEAFAKEDYATTITKLTETEKLLGQTNPKIMYLLIQAQSRLPQVVSGKDIETIAAMKQNIATYLKKYENTANIEEKYRDIYKLSEAFEKYPVTMNDLSGIQKGNQDAMFRVANYYMSIGNHDKAVDLFNKLATLNNKHGLLMTAYMYDYGYGVQNDFVKAMEYYKKASAQNMPVAEFYISCLHNNGQGVEKDSVKAAAIFLKALPGIEALAAQKYPLALSAAGSAYLYGQHIQPDYAKALQYNTAAMELGQTDGIYQLYLHYNEGWGVPADQEKAWKYLMMAAEKNCTHAMETVAAGYASSYKNSSKKDPNTMASAISWYTKAAEKGSTDAMYELSELYMANSAAANPMSSMLGPFTNFMTAGAQGTDKNIAKSVEWCSKAAAGEHTNAMFKMGVFYMVGTGVTMDEAKGKMLIKKAADKGQTDAAYTYGTYCYKGVTMEKNYPEALKYLTISANAGNVMAMETLSTMYEKGQGVPKDKVTAKQWADKVKSLKKKPANPGKTAKLGRLM